MVSCKRLQERGGTGFRCHHVGAEGDGDEDLSQVCDGRCQLGHRRSTGRLWQLEQQQWRRQEPDHDRRVAVAVGRLRVRRPGVPARLRVVGGGPEREGRIARTPDQARSPLGRLESGPGRQQLPEADRLRQGPARVRPVLHSADGARPRASRPATGMRSSRAPAVARRCSDPGCKNVFDVSIPVKNNLVTFAQWVASMPAASAPRRLPTRP